MQKINLLLFVLFSLFLLFFSVSVFSQNLVVNGNFSLYFRCPGSYNHYNNNLKNLLPGWSTVNQSTPDFFHRCSRNTDVGVPVNFAGIAEPFDGDGYLGMIFLADRETYPFSPTYSEHITGTLEIPLEGGKQYCFSMYYFFAQNSGIGTNGTGVYFSSEKPSFSDIEDIYAFEPQLVLHQDSVLSMQPGWKKLSSVYHARGGEKYITIGNFLSVSQSLSVKNTPKVINDTRFFAYYYIDDVRLTPLSENGCDVQTALISKTGQGDHFFEDSDENETEFVAGTTYTLKNVYFDFEKSELRPESFPELNIIAEFLNENKLIHIIISGHTDNIGSDSFNKALSESRARAVFEYLYSKGIPLNRMKFTGMGSKISVSDNDTEYGRQQNRRVEIEFYIP